MCHSAIIPNRQPRETELPQRDFATCRTRAERTSETIETDMERGERERDGDDESGARVRGDRLDGQDEERE